MNGYLAVIDILRADGPLGLLIGGSGVSTARVFPGDAPQKAKYPMVRVESFDSDPHDTMSGIATTDTEVVKVFNCAPEDSDCYLMSERTRDALDGASGLFNGVTMEYCRYLRTDTYNVEALNQSTTAHQRIRVHEHDYEVRVRVNS